MSNFIVTFKKDIAEELISMGYSLISNDNGKYTFLDTDELKMNFSDKEVIKTNKMTF